MDVGGIVVLASFIFMLGWIFWAVLSKKEVYGQGALFSFGMLFLGAIFAHDKALTNSFFFSLSSSVIIVVLADPYLIKNTLSYGENSWKILKTPWWMGTLWVIVLTQLCYIWTIIEPKSAWEIDQTFIRKWFLFVVIGFMIFFIFELIASNFTKWWSRRNCQKILGEVPLYALVAELATVMTLPLIFSYVIKFSVWAALICGIIMGIVISTYFCYSCKTHKNKYEKNQKIKTERN